MKSNNVALCAATLSLLSGCILVADRSDPGERLDARFSLDWSVVDAETKGDVNCFAVGADHVRVRAENRSTSETVVDLFDCDDNTGETFRVSAGEYLIHVDLVRCGASAACTHPVVLSEAAPIVGYSVWDDGIQDLGHFVFLVDTTVLVR